MHAESCAGSSTGWKQPREVIKMFCFRIRKRLIPYSEGSLSPEAAEAVARHLAKCKRCSGELAAVRKASTALRCAKTPAMEPAADLWNRIERQIAAPARVARPWPMRGMQYSGAFVAAAILLFAVINVTRLGDPTIGSIGTETRPTGSISKPTATESPNNGTSFSVEIAPQSESTVAASNLPVIEKRPVAAKQGMATRTSEDYENLSRPAAPGEPPSVSSPMPDMDSVDNTGDTYTDRDELKLKSEMDFVMVEGNVPAGWAGSVSGRASGMASNSSEVYEGSPDGDIVLAGKPELSDAGETLLACRFLNSSDATPFNACEPCAQEQLTSVDLLNRADEEARRAALFSYP